MNTEIFKVLIVDDEPEIRELLSAVFEAENLSTSTASNGVEALDKVKSEWFDVILSDYQMPKMNGIKLLEEVRTLKIPTPFLILTGFAEKDIVIKALKLGATDFFEKPYSAAKLVEFVKNYAAIGSRIHKIYLSDSDTATKDVRYHLELMRKQVS